MNTLDAFTYKGNEIIILEEKHGTFAVDIRIDDYDGHMIAGYCGLDSQSEAVTVGKAFVDGLRHVEETGIQNR